MNHFLARNKVTDPVILQRAKKDVQRAKKNIQRAKKDVPRAKISLKAVASFYALGSGNRTSTHPGVLNLK